MEQVLLLRAKEAQLASTISVVLQWAKRLHKLETLFRHGRLVSGRYILEVTASPAVAPEQSYSATGELRLLSDGTCQGSANETFLPPQTGSVASIIQNGRWRAKTIQYTLMYASAPYLYSVEVVGSIIAQTDGGAHHHAVIELQGTWRSAREDLAADPRNRGSVDRMILRGPLPAEIDG